MIQALTVWAADSFHIVEARSIILGVTGRVGGPASVLDLDARHYLALIEGIAREADHHARALDELYAASIPPRPESAAEKRAERRAEIDRLARIFGG